MNSDVPTNNTTPAAGWYPDPAASADSGILRYWDGQQWTEETKETLNATPPPVQPSVTSVSPPPVFQSTAPSSSLIMSPFGQYYSGWWRRAGATTIDSLITSSVIVFFGIFLFIGYSMSLNETELDALLTSEMEPTTNSTFFGLILIIALLGLTIVFIYQVIQLSLWGKTVGDRALGIRVASASTGDIPSWGQNIRRTLILSAFSLGGFLPVLGILFSLGALVNYLSMLWDSQRRCWHDIVGGTVVLKTST